MTTPADDALEQLLRSGLRQPRRRRSRPPRPGRCARPCGEAPAAAPFPGRRSRHDGARAHIGYRCLGGFVAGTICHGALVPRSSAARPAAKRADDRHLAPPADRLGGSRACRLESRSDDPGTRSLGGASQAAAADGEFLGRPRRGGPRRPDDRRAAGHRPDARPSGHPRIARRGRRLDLLYAGAARLGGPDVPRPPGCTGDVSLEAVATTEAHDLACRLLYAERRGDDRGLGHPGGGHLHRALLRRRDDAAGRRRDR